MHNANDHESWACLAISRRWQKILSIKPLQNPGRAGIIQGGGAMTQLIKELRLLINAIARLIQTIKKEG